MRSAVTHRFYMAAILALKKKEEIKNILDVGGHHKDVAKYLKQACPGITRGISVRSVRRFCQKENISRFSSKKYAEREVEKIVRRASFKVRLILFNVCRLVCDGNKYFYVVFLKTARVQSKYMKVRLPKESKTKLICNKVQLVLSVLAKASILQCFINTDLEACPLL